MIYNEHFVVAISPASANLPKQLTHASTVRSLTFGFANKPTKIEIPLSVTIFDAMRSCTESEFNNDAICSVSELDVFIYGNKKYLIRIH